MAFTVNLYTLQKRDNSTKRPTGSGRSFSCVMKHGCGILNPAITFDIGVSGNPAQYNYAYIPAFNRYYFIEEWYFEDSLWTASLKVDVLATYKTEIGNSSLYVLRSAGAYDGNITDNLYPAKTGCSFDSSVITSPWTASALYVLGVVSKEATVGSLKYYILSSSQISQLCGYLLDDVVNDLNDFKVDGVTNAVTLSIVDPIQYIKSCIMLPVTINDIENISSGGYVQVYNYPTRVLSLFTVSSNSRVVKNYSFAIKKHPDTSSRGNYVNASPYTNITLTIPPFGSIDIDTSVTCNASILNVEVSIDCITGKGVLIVSANGIVLNRIESQIGVPINLSQVTKDYIGVAGALGGATASTMASLTAGDPFGAGASIISGIGNAVNGLKPRANTLGTTGSFVSNMGNFRLDHQFFRPVADDLTHNGRPLCQIRQINTLSGYMIIQDGDVTIDGTSNEDSLIRSYLEGGFYYE